jgi:tripartite-type tricarboxylate transporter receptor subunit TctC
LNYASPGTGTAGHMTGELFKTVTGTKIAHVPYKGAGSVITDLLSGYVQMSFSGPGSVMPHIHARKLKALAVAYPRRTAGLEQVPTFIEAGYPGVDAAQWYAVLTTGGTPQPVVDKLNREIVRILQLPEVKEKLLASGYVAAPSTPQELAQFMRDELAKWQKVVKASGVRPE